LHDLSRDLEGAGVGAELAPIPRQRCRGFDEFVGGQAPGDPTVGDAGGAADRRVGVSADDDRHRELW